MPETAAFKDTHFERRRQIAETLVKHGFGALLGGLELRAHKNGAGPPSQSLAAPQHVRIALEELGTTYIKLGQFFSTRADIVPPDYLAELAKLQDDAPAFDTSAAVEVVESELGRPLGEIFVRFDRQPLAAASIGQVHAAQLADGTEVIVKVRRPGVVELVEKDLEILHNLAAAACRRWEFARQNGIGQSIEVFLLERNHERGKTIAHLLIQRACHSEIDQSERAVRLDEEVPRMKVAVKEPVLENHLEDRLRAAFREDVATDNERVRLCEVADPDAVNAFLGQHLRSGQLPEAGWRAASVTSMPRKSPLSSWTNWPQPSTLASLQ